MREGLRGGLRGFACCLLLVAGTARGEVDTANPFSGPPMPSPTPDPGANGIFYGYPIQQTGADAIHGGRVTIGLNIPNPPGSNVAAWTSLITTPLTSTATLAFPVDVKDALDSAATMQSTLDGGLTEAAFAVFEAAALALGGDANVSIPAAQPSFLGYSPLRARWLRSQWGFPPGLSPNPKEKLFSYQDPDVFREIRERGARLYCAARAAQFHQGMAPASLGQRAAFSVNVLGQQIDFLVTESTLVLDGPERFTAGGANDGAQTFAIPMHLGTRITPISFLGGFDEMRVPLVLVTGDSEVKNQADWRNVLVDWVVKCQGGLPGKPIGALCTLQPVYVTQFSKEYQTVTHVDAALSAHKSPGVTAHFPLFILGGVRVSLGLDKLQLNVGELSASNPRVLESPFLGWPPPRTGRRFENPQSGVQYHEGRWALRPLSTVLNTGPAAWFVEPDGDTNPFWRSPFHNPFTSPPPLDVRLFNDDDHALVSTTGLVIDGTVSGVLGGGFGPFHVDLTVKGGITGTVNNDHVIREALFGAALGGPGMTPITGVSIRPRTRAKATLDATTATLHLSLHIDLFAGSIDIDIDKKLLSIPGTTLANYNSDNALSASDEQFIFRLGTGSRDGNVMKQPAVVSHFPGEAEFNSFDTDVDACLDDPAPNPPPPPPCMGVPASGEPPTAQICAYGPATAGLVTAAVAPFPALPSLPPQVCTQIGTYVGGLALGANQKMCVAKLLGFLCEPVSQQQLAKGHSVVSTVLDLSDDAQGTELADIVKECVDAFLPPNLPSAQTKAVANAIASSLLQFGVCADDATLLPDNEVLGTVTGNTPPPLMPGAPCTPVGPS